MDFGKKIYELRKKNNITQEQLAKAVGVSAPAVCKWETGASLPDITLVAPIARMLNTNLNELFSFEETLSDTEIKEIMDKIKDKARQEGLNAGVALSYDYLKQYPNVDKLKLYIATFPAMMAYTADEEYKKDEDKYQKLLDESIGILEELTHSGDDTVRLSAILHVAGRYLGQNRLDEAEVMLRKLPNQDYDARHMFPSIYLRKGEDEKVFECTQSNMLQDVQHVMFDIRNQHSVYIKNKDYKKALKCARDYLSLVELAGTSAMIGNDLLVDTYLAMGQIEKATECLLDFIDEIKKVSGDYRNSFYYSYISDKVAIASSDLEQDVRKSLYQSILLNERYNILLNSKEVINKLNELKKSFN